MKLKVYKNKSFYSHVTSITPTSVNYFHGNMFQRQGHETSSSIRRIANRERQNRTSVRWKCSATSCRNDSNFILRHFLSRNGQSIVPQLQTRWASVVPALCDGRQSATDAANRVWSIGSRVPRAFRPKTPAIFPTLFSVICNEWPIRTD